MLLVGQRFAVIGTWDPAPCPEGYMPIYLQPGPAYGHGWEQPTRAMLERMGRINFRGKTVLDIGTGTGILAIAAYRLGAAIVLATEQDPRVLEEARANIEANDLPILFSPIDGVPEGEWQIALCNLGDAFWVAAHLRGRAQEILYSTKTGVIIHHA